MPDHLHLLIIGQDAEADLKRFISRYKQNASFNYKKSNGVPLWQINFSEHILRKDEETLNVTKYIINNSEGMKYKFLEDKKWFLEENLKNILKILV